MNTTQKQVFQSAVDKFSPITIKRATLKSFDKRTYTAEIFIEGSPTTSTKNIPVARDIQSRVMRQGVQLLIITFDPQNPQASLVSSVYSGQAAAPNSASAFATGTTNVTTPAGDTSTYVSIAASLVQLQTGPGTVRVRADGDLFIGGATGGGTAKVRIKATVTDNTGATPVTTIQYFPNSVGWHWFASNNNIYFSYGFDAYCDVPEGTHSFQIQFRANSLPTGAAYVDLDGNGSVGLTALEL